MHEQQLLKAKIEVSADRKQSERRQPSHDRMSQSTGKNNATNTNTLERVTGARR